MGLITQNAPEGDDSTSQTWLSRAKTSAPASFLGTELVGTFAVQTWETDSGNLALIHPLTATSGTTTAYRALHQHHGENLASQYACLVIPQIRTQVIHPYTPDSSPATPPGTPRSTKRAGSNWRWCSGSPHPTGSTSFATETPSPAGTRARHPPSSRPPTSPPPSRRSPNSPPMSRPVPRPSRSAGTSPATSADAATAESATTSTSSGRKPRQEATPPTSSWAPFPPRSSGRTLKSRPR
ncbi:hypothetical protein OIM90_32240 [Streptomyces sp. AD16]|nr:hypothetical protein OIM90_32240 [Streptomyces sp. AD16]